MGLLTVREHLSACGTRVQDMFACDAHVFIELRMWYIVCVCMYVCSAVSMSSLRYVMCTVYVRTYMHVLVAGCLYSACMCKSGCDDNRALYY